MRYIFIVLVALFFIACNDTQQTIEVIKDTKELNAIIDAKLLGSVEAINSSVSTNIAILTAMLAVIGFLFYDFSKKKREMIKEIEDKMTIIIDNKFKEKSEDLQDELSQKTISIITTSNKTNRLSSRKEEFLRNVLYYDLNKMRSTEQLDEKNVAQAFSDYADRFYIISQLTSGIEKHRSKALSKLGTGVYRKITRLKSFEDYIEFLKGSDIDMDTLDKITKLEHELVS